MVARYRARLSGPLLDRIDLHVQVPALSYAEMAAECPGEASAPIRARVERARRAQEARGAACNARLSGAQLRRAGALDAAGRRLMEQAVDKLGLSARAHDRVLKVARTIADLDGSGTIRAVHLGEAIQYRGLDRSPESR